MRSLLKSQFEFPIKAHRELQQHNNSNDACEHIHTYSCVHIHSDLFFETSKRQKIRISQMDGQNFENTGNEWRKANIAYVFYVCINMQYSTSSENYSSSIKGDSPSKWGNKDDKGFVYKKSSYQYSSSGNNNLSNLNKSADPNIDQLDALLEDLKHERQITKDKDLLSSSTNYRTIEHERGEPSGKITKTTRVIKTSQQSTPHTIHDDIENFSTSDYSTLKSNGYPSIKRDYQQNESHYGSSNLYESKSKLYESNRVLNSTEIIPPATTTTTTTHLEKDLQDLPLTEDILPLPGTKVTTTVRTYTYEVPATGTLNRGTQLNSSSRYNTIQRGEINSTLQSSPSAQTSPTIPPTVVYNTESYSTINRNSERPIVSNQIYEVREHRETNTLQNNLQPQPRSPHPIGTNKSIVYKVNTTENIHTTPEYNNYPSRGPDYTVQSPQNGPHSPPHGNYPPGPSTSKYFYKESSNVINTIHGPGGPSGTNVHPGYPSSPEPAHKISPSVYPPSGNGYLPHGSPNTSTVTYKYSSTTNTHRGPDGPYGSPTGTTQPAPFPVDGMDYPGGANPPQRVDDLMQSLGPVDSVDKADRSIHRKREIETAVATPSQHVPTINKAGKEVYYPPGHEMMIKREEMAAGSATGGRWAKGSGMYEYESGYKSKTKTKSGGAMIPVCLPLCCAMPCSIM